MENLALAAQIAALVFALLLGVLLIIGMMKDKKLTADEAAKVAIIGMFIYMMVVNGNRVTEWMIYDQGVILIVLGSVLLLAGIDIYKAKKLQ